MDRAHQLPAKVRYLVFKARSPSGVSASRLLAYRSILPRLRSFKTWEVTNFSRLRSGDEVNLEVDVIAKYVERLMAFRQPENGESLTLKLTKLGYK